VRNITVWTLLFLAAASSALAAGLEPTKPSAVLMLRSSSICPMSVAGSLAEIWSIVVDRTEELAVARWPRLVT